MTYDKLQKKKGEWYKTSDDLKAGRTGKYRQDREINERKNKI